MSINTVTITGRAGKDPEVKYFENGTQVAEVSMAVDRFKKDEGPDWHKIKLWGKQAQVAADYLKKGGLFGVTGRLEIEKWIDRETGKNRERIVIVGERLQLLGSKRDTEDSGGGAPADDSDVPF